MTAVVICNWRDLQPPETGRSEHSVEAVARILAAGGHPDTILCAKVAGRPAHPACRTAAGSVASAAF